MCVCYYLHSNPLRTASKSQIALFVRSQMRAEAIFVDSRLVKSYSISLRANYLRRVNHGVGEINFTYA